MVLHREGRLVGAAQALVGAVEQRDVRHLDVRRAAISGIDAEAVVLQVISTLPVVRSLTGWLAPRWPRSILRVLPPSASASSWWPRQMPNSGTLLVEHALDRRHGVAAGRRRIARAVRQEHAVGLVAQDVLGGRRRRHHRDLAAGVGEAAQDVALGAVVDGDDVVLGLAELAVALAQRPLGLVPLVGLLGRDLDGEVHAVEARASPARDLAQRGDVELAVGRMARRRRWARRRRGCGA